MGSVRVALSHGQTRRRQPEGEVTIPDMARIPYVPERPARPTSCPVCGGEYDAAQYGECPHCAAERGYMLFPNSMQDLMAAQRQEIQRQRAGCIVVALLIVAAVVGLLIWVF